MNNTTSLSRVDGTTALYDNMWLAGLMTRLQAQNQRSVLGSDGVSYVQASPCLLLIDTSNAVLFRLCISSIHPPIPRLIRIISLGS